MTVMESHPVLGDMPLVPQPLHFSDQTSRISGPPPELGEHTQSVLMEILGFDAEAIEELKSKNII